MTKQRRFDLESLRKRLGFNQSQMAAEMGLSARAYFSLEQDPTSMNQRHIMLAELVSLQSAVERRDPSLAHPTIAKLARDFVSIPLPTWHVYAGRLTAALTSPTKLSVLHYSGDEEQAKKEAKMLLRRGEIVSVGAISPEGTPLRVIHSHEVEKWIAE